MDYKESLDYLFSRLPMFSRVGAPAYKPGLDTTLELDRLYGHPHRRFRSIHIAGTNGKGSTSHMLASVLQEQGYKVGLYTSPHLVDFRERIRVNGEMIPQERVRDFVEDYRARLERGELSCSPSFFELTMMLAFKHFAEERVDYAVVEVGMGGRLDSTNIISPLFSVVTNISKDHTQFLGATLPAIASEKAGIIKAGVPVVIGERISPEVARVFSDKAAEVGAPITFAEDFVPAFPFEPTIPLRGEYQRKNLRTVLAALAGLRDAGVEISDRAIDCGLRNVVSNTHLMGRWTVLEEQPLVIADTGHNEAGLGYNMHQLRTLLESRPGATLRMVVGFVADKAVPEILPLFPREAEYYICRAQIPRAMAVDTLAGLCGEAGLRFRSFQTVPEAYAAALADASPSDIIYVGGSTFIVADHLASLPQA